MVYENGVYMRNENLVKLIEDAFPDSLYYPDRR